MFTKTPDNKTPFTSLKPILLTGLIAGFLTAMTFSPAEAGGRHYNDQGSGFILFDIFGQAPNSKYRRPQVRGFKKKVGGYSYRYVDTLNGFGNKPYDFSPINNRSVHSTRLGEGGPYIGD